MFLNPCNFFCICLLSIQFIIELVFFWSFSKIHVVVFPSTHKTFSWTFPYSIWGVCFHKAAHSAMFSHSQSSIVNIVFSSSYIYLWFHGPVRPKNAHNHLLVWTYREWTMYGCACGVSIAVVQFSNIPSSTWLVDRPYIKWWNWNASQSGLFYGSDRKYGGDEREEKGAFYNRLTTWSIFPVFRW